MAIYALILFIYIPVYHSHYYQLNFSLQKHTDLYRDKDKGLLDIFFFIEMVA